MVTRVVLDRVFASFAAASTGVSDEEKYSATY